VEQPIREEIELGFLLDADELGEVLVEDRADSILVDATPVEAAGGRNDLFGAGIDAVLVGEDVDRDSLSIPALVTATGKGVTLRYMR